MAATGEAGRHVISPDEALRHGALAAFALGTTVAGRPIPYRDTSHRRRTDDRTKGAGGFVRSGLASLRSVHAA